MDQKIDNSSDNHNFGKRWTLKHKKRAVMTNLVKSAPAKGFGPFLLYSLKIIRHPVEKPTLYFSI